MLSLNPDMWLNPENITSRFGSWRHRSGDQSPLGPRWQRLLGGLGLPSVGPGPAKHWILGLRVSSL